MPLYAVQTKKSYEQTAADMITNNDTSGDVYAALSPESMISYIIVEADNEHAIENTLDDIPHARKVLPSETSMAEIEQFLTPTSDVKGVSEGAVVELTDGPFQGDKAKVTKIAESSERVTVELYESTVPIPVEVRGDQIRVLDQDEWE
jgi:transcriptional antiterminator NusG